MRQGDENGAGKKATTYEFMCGAGRRKKDLRTDGDVWEILD